MESKTTVSQNIFYRKAFKNGIDFTKRQFSKNLYWLHFVKSTKLFEAKCF
ncbi:hypothetical protein COPCOM_01265 [Coprococcus comes ATCC 27758]|uniref:Uncharacterized protein n=1 Tax=Coprococcus comes ATCC 27758 TaxID=470146 RepID=C0B7Z2_9FIRM|nr:hypothetical protein COPCOM_01265 [Coprococcus comes ATCC 27758]